MVQKIYYKLDFDLKQKRKILYRIKEKIIWMSLFFLLIGGSVNFISDINIAHYLSTKVVSNFEVAVNNVGMVAVHTYFYFII